jgi:hypothetical protein
MEDKNGPNLQAWNATRIEVEDGLFENLHHTEVSVNLRQFRELKFRS